MRIPLVYEIPDEPCCNDCDWLRFNTLSLSCYVFGANVQKSTEELIKAGTEFKILPCNQCLKWRKGH
jgi:hypothetical protein